MASGKYYVISILMRPPKLADSEVDMHPFLQSAKKNGVKKIVFVSLLGVERNPIVPHRKIENMLKGLGVPYCFLRPSVFMQNLNTNHREEIKERNAIFIPAGKSKTSFIDTNDVFIFNDKSWYCQGCNLRFGTDYRKRTYFV